MRGQILICLGLFSSIYASRGAGANLFLRHHLNIALRRAPWRLRLHSSDRALMVRMTRVWPSLLLDLSRVIQPEKRSWWDRAGFWAYWRWKSRSQPGRPRIEPTLRELNRRMSKKDPLWALPGALRNRSNLFSPPSKRCANRKHAASLPSGRRRQGISHRLKVLAVSLR